MSKTTILYKDIAPGADEDASLSSGSALSGSDVSRLPFETVTPPIITGEINGWGLDGTYEPIENQLIAFWSFELSGENCYFQNPPQITLTFSKQYTGTGLTLVFGMATEDYCPEVNIKWYQDNNLKADTDFYPDSTKYYCKQAVENYNKIVVTLKKTSLPYRRARLDQIIFGIFRRFDMTEIRNAHITTNMNLIAAELPFSTLKWTLENRENIDFLFQFKQPLEVYNDNFLLGVYYLDGFKQKGTTLYELECYDAFGILSENDFPGGVYTGKSAKELFSEIINGDFEIFWENSVEDILVTGAILPGKKRDALHQLLFRWGVCVATDGVNGIRVFKPGVELKEILNNRVYVGSTVETSALPTKVIVTARTYTQKAGGSVVIGGVEYEETTSTYTITNPNVTATDKQNVIEIQDPTLVSPADVAEVAQRVYDFYMMRDTNKGKVMWRGDKLGDYVEIPNGWGGSTIGYLTSMSITLSNTVAAQVETVGGSAK